MAKQAKDYPVTTPYGKVAGYPLNNGVHYGEDRIMPRGTPILVNGTQIGLSGLTGYTTGAHLHVGKWANGKSYNPAGGGFAFKSAIVTQIDTLDNDANGKYVRVQGDGYSWVYLHMDSVTAKVGQKLVASAPPKPPAPAYPKTVRVTAFPFVNVRSQPSSKAPLAGSRILPFGTVFRVVGEVKGESVGGNNKWYKSMYSNYIWSGGVK